MKRTKYIVVEGKHTVRIKAGGGLDTLSLIDDGVRMIQVLPENEVFDPPPWVRHGIDHLGWQIITKDLGESGLNDHGMVDWKAVATALAGALDSVLEEDDEPEAIEQSHRALDDFRIAQTEEAMRTTSEEKAE